ncbi:MAG: isocitrate dehydrogenase, partial [Arcticibacterium sp.]
LDNRGSHFYLAMYWAEELITQTKDAELQARFATVAAELKSNETKIIKELVEVQGTAVEMDGYYQPSDDKTSAAMRPSSTLNDIISAM